VRKYIIVGASVVLAVVLAVVLYLLMSSKAALVTEIPEVFRGQSILYITNQGRTFIESQNGGSIYPIIHDTKALYVLSGTKDVIKHYHIDKENKELVIEQNTSQKIRDGSYFQLVTIPTEKYQPIVEDSKIKVRIKFKYLNNKAICLEYNLQNQTTRIIDTNLVGK